MYTQPLTRNRIESIDLLKGLVMVIMALDHVRDYFHYDSFIFDPTDPGRTTIPIFFTRFITHYCAPTFSLLAGLSAYLVGQRKNRRELSGFLFKRGLWLVFIELTFVNFGWHFDIYFTDVVLQVIWILGISMIFLSVLIYIPVKYILLFSCILIFGHNLLDNEHFGGSVLWLFLHERLFLDNFHGHSLVVGYVVIPWVGVMALGYCLGTLYDKTFDAVKRRQILNGIGIASLVLFLILRGTNIYGDPNPWHQYPTILQSVFSFLNVNKYPPSLSYLLVTLGVSFLFLANTENVRGRVVNFFSVYGRVPFFYYVLHIYFIHFFALIAAELTGFGWHTMILTKMPFRVAALKGYGFSLEMVYLVWIIVVVLLYPFCVAFDRYKQQHKDRWWLSYL